MSTDANLMGDLLAHFTNHFIKSSSFPPQWDRCHQIHLLPETTPVAIQPHRYALMQKQELERQCAAMLQTRVIQPSPLLPRRPFYW
jgi:hypothetical protein